ncbi:MAG: hypothetical protein JOY99_07710 [Sphingomonadaceae bacterium]|nr:hypothetical protein [Sphingomonadaceae bacterium]
MIWQGLSGVMPSQKTLNAQNLQALGAGRLAELLLEIGAGDASIKRRLRMELMAHAGTAELAREIAKRLSTIAKARSFVDWNKTKALVADLSEQRRAIVEQIGKDDPGEALALLWRFIALAETVFARCDDSNGYVGQLFHDAVAGLGPLAQRAGVEPIALANRAFEALQTNHYGEYDGLIEILAPQLGAPGLKHLKTLFMAWAAEPQSKPSEDERRVIGWGSGRGAIYEDEIEERHRASGVRLALEQIADAQDDVDGYIAQQEKETRKSPLVAAAIARRLLKAGRPQEALVAIEGADTRRGWSPSEWEQARIDALIALGRLDEAQSFRWDCFTRTLSVDHLRAYLKKVPAFEDFDAEQRAMEHAGSVDIHQALAFFITWPALKRANTLVLSKAPDLNGDHYELLSPAADALEDKYPVAATLLRRAMIDFTLSRARATRYKHAARHLAECASLASSIEDYGAFPDHQAYVETLRAVHGRKAGFWQP